MIHGTFSTLSSPYHQYNRPMSSISSSTMSSPRFGSQADGAEKLEVLLQKLSQVGPRDVVPGSIHLATHSKFGTDVSMVFSVPGESFDKRSFYKLRYVNYHGESKIDVYPCDRFGAQKREESEEYLFYEIPGYSQSGWIRYNDPKDKDVIGLGDGLGFEKKALFDQYASILNDLKQRIVTGEVMQVCGGYSKSAYMFRDIR